jgi:dihydroorotase-like cyclic amidohydrolase
MAWAPSRKFGLAGKKGALTPGHDADFVIADMSADWTISNDDVLSKIGWTCYDGRQVSAAIETTYVRGAEVFANGKVTGNPGQGKLAAKSEVFI